MRHYRTNSAIRNAASITGLESSTPHTNPKGERYSLIFADSVTFGQIAVPFDNKIPRPSLHRKAIASVNSRFEPINLDLFSTPPVINPANEALGCLITTIKPPHFEGQSVPRDIYIGVPYTNLKAWHIFIPVTEVIAAYRPAQELHVLDSAFATLKKKLRDVEDEE
jgi:hypothetical protein